MANGSKDRSDVVIFLGGVACLVVAVALGFFLAHLAATKLAHLEPQDYLRHDARGETEEIRAGGFFLSNVNALMWMVFGLGTTLTLLGLRRMTRPILAFQPQPPLGPIGDVFKNPD